jgi:hypothetical protein
MWQARRHVSDMQLFPEDLLNLDPTPNGTDANREAQRALLAADSLRASGRLRLRVRGESMLPSLWPGDMVEIASCPAENVRPGEVVLALRDGRFYLHRFVGRFPSGGFLLRGDSMPAADPEFARDGLLGRLASRRAPLRWWSRAVGRLLCYCRPARTLALNLHAVRLRRRDLQLDAAATTDIEIYPAQAPEPECPRHTGIDRTSIGHTGIDHTCSLDAQPSIPELTNAGI